MVFVDNYILIDTVRLYHTNIKSDTSEIFSSRCVFIDHASGYIIIKHQVDISAIENVKDKLTFDKADQIKVLEIKV